MLEYGDNEIEVGSLIIPSWEDTMSSNYYSRYKIRVPRQRIRQDKIKTFYMGKIVNENAKKGDDSQHDDAVIFQLTSVFIAISLFTPNVQFEYISTAKKHDCIYLKKQGILINEAEKGVINRIAFPIDPKGKNPIVQAFDPEDDVLIFKTCYLGGEEHVMLMDEYHYIKILKFEGEKLKVVHNYFVHEYFQGAKSEMRRYVFCNNMVYNNTLSYMCQDREAAKKNVWEPVCYKNIWLKNHQSGFPMSSSSNNIFAINPTPDFQQDKNIQKILIAPPMNGQQVLQAVSDAEFFFDGTDYIVRITVKINKFTYKNQVLVNVYGLNGELV